MHALGQQEVIFLFDQISGLTVYDGKGEPPTSDAITGVPEAIDSTATRPKDS